MSLPHAVPSSRQPISPATAVAQLCPRCALCCNGVLFKDVELQPGDDAGRLASLGLPVSETATRESHIANRKFPQPCAALDGCRCRVYPERPARCRQFDCALLQSVQAGKTEVAAALRVIRVARQRAEKVRTLLRQTGDADETRPLSLRFKRTKTRFETLPSDGARADAFRRLTLAVHDLNRLLREKFYPG